MRNSNPLSALAISIATTLTLSTTVSASLYGESNLNHSCVLQTPILSCTPQANPSKVDTCCTETFGGLLVSTQFWDTYTGLEAQGQVLPGHSWTLHGLWPDFCNGSYTQYCDLGRQFDPAPSPRTVDGLDNGTVVPPWNGSRIDKLIEPFGRNDLLAYMNKYWINQNSPNRDLWAHEFSKHATCFSTFDTPCYGLSSPPHSDIVDFFSTAIHYFRRHPTYTWLAQADIIPSNTTSYTLSEIQDALASGTGGVVPYLGCSGKKFNETLAGKGSTDDGRTVLSEVWYYMYVFGRPQDGVWVPVDASVGGGKVTSCAKTPGAVWYYERALGSEV